MKINKFLVPVLGLPMILGTSLTIMVSCGRDIDKDGRFKTDPWTTVVAHANQGLDHLKHYYEINSFIGLERKIKIYGIEQTVRVIGEKEDYIADASGKPTGKTATLTFQFSHILSGIGPRSEDILPVMLPMDAYSWGWENSYVRKWLRDTTAETSFTNLMEEQLGEGAIQKVSKNSVEYDGSAKPHSETFFLPALIDIFNKNQIGQDDFKEYNSYIKEANIHAGGEPQKPYTYYQRCIDQEDQSPYNKQNWSIALSDLAGHEQPYWLRTSFVFTKYDYNAHFAIWSDGRKCQYPSLSKEGEGEIDDVNALGIAPIFCIGQNE